MRKLIFKSPAVKGWTENVALFDSAEEFIGAPTGKPDFSGDWYGYQTRAQCIQKMRSGDLSLVPASDKLLEKLEAVQAPATNMWRTVDAVSGGVPNVPAFLAGHPVAMRRRQRMAADLAPLTVVVDLVCSAGVSNDQLAARGAAILALVRLLSGRRAIELWVGCYAHAGDTENKDNIGAFFRMDTSPVDLARAAHMLSAASVARGMGYGALAGVWNGSKNYSWLRWPYGKGSESRTLTPVALQGAFGGDVLYVPGAFNRDQISDDPAAWLKGMIEKYSMPAVEAAA